MSDVRTKANSLNLSFPIPGVNNSSQGFRDNTALVQQTFFQTSDELDFLQKTRLRFTGDATGQSDRFANAVVVGAADPTLEINFTLSNTIGSPANINTSTGDYTLSFDAKGRLTAYASVPYTIAWATGHGDGQVIGATGDVSMGSGTGSIVLPQFTFNAQGRLTATGTKTINYGLMNQKLTDGSLLIGGTGNVSRELVQPTTAGQWVLSSEGGVLSWQLAGAGTVTSVTGGEGIKVSGEDEAPVVDLALDKLTAAPGIVDTDELIYLSAVDNKAKRLTMSQLRTKIVKVSADTVPVLGGNLDVAGFSIVGSTTTGVTLFNSSTPTAGVRVNNAGVAIQAQPGGSVIIQSPVLTLNGTNWPATTGVAGQYLTLTASGQLAWTNLQTFYQTIANTFFVGNQGNDTTGNGSLNNPYKTIAKAMDMVPLNDDGVTYTIMLLGGEYNEDVFVKTNIKNIALEGFFGATNSVIKGRLQVEYNVDRFLMSKITLDNSDQDINDPTATLMMVNGVGSAEVRDCQILRGPNGKSDLPAIVVSQQIVGDVTFINTTVQGMIENSTIGDEGGRLVLQNLGLPNNGWTGLRVEAGSSTLVSGAPLMKGIRHNGGVLVMENVGSIMPESYTISVSMPSLPKWENGVPVFITEDGNEATEDTPENPLARVQDADGNYITVELLDEEGNPIPDPEHPGDNLTTTFIQAEIEQPDVETTYTVGLYSVADASSNGIENKLELTNVNFYNNGSFSKLYKSGDCVWSFTRVKRRSDQDFITGPRLAYDVQPDEGNFMAHYVASGSNLRYEDTNAVVPDGMIDPKSGNTFHVTLTAGATLTLKTPEATAYAPGPLNTSGELYSEVLVAVKQDNIGGRNVVFATSENKPITWISSTAGNISPNGLTFYLFRYFSRTRTWVGQKQVDANSLKITPITSSSYNLAAADAGSYIRRNFATDNQVVVPSNTNVQFAVGTQIQIVQTGNGKTEIVPAGGVVINTPFGRKISRKFGRALLTKIASNAWDLSGDLDVDDVVEETITIDNSNINISSTNVLVTGKTLI
jgi:hypothetical protein